MPIIIFGKWPFVLIVAAIFLWWRYTEKRKRDGGE